MTPVLSYLIKANIILAVLYGFYFLFFRRDTFYGHIRWYFLTTIAAAIIFPLIDISPLLTGSPAALSVSQYIPNVDAVYQYVFIQSQITQLSQMPHIETDTIDPFITRTFPFGLIVLWCWLLVCVYMLGKRLWQLTCITRLWRYFSRQYHNNGTVIAIDRNIQPFSFFGRIFLNPALYSKDELDEIIAHERIHCRQGHTIDNLLAETLLCLCWFNPAVWLLRRDLKQNLEYHTDRMTLRTGFDRKHYQYSLLRVSGNNFQIVNHFHFNQFNHLKKRIIMLNKKESPRIMTAKYLLVIPALAAALLTVQASGLQAPANESVNAINEKPVLTDMASVSEINGYDLLAEMAVIENEATKNAATNLRGLNAHAHYPDTGKQASVSNIIFPSGNSDPLVIIDGKAISIEEMHKINPETIESIEVLKGEYATNLYGEKAADGVIIIKSKTGTNQLSPRVFYKNFIPLETIPDYRQRQGTTYAPEGDNIPKATLVSGDLQVRIYDTEIQSKNEIKVIGYEQMPNKPLVIVDGKEFVDIKNIDPQNIKTISIFKDQSAMAIYGAKAKDGVIVVTTKRGIIYPAQALSKGDFAFFETIQVSGTVTNVKDLQPMPGVAIVVKGSNTGSVTDLSGKYSLLVPLNANLLFSYPGMISREIAVENRQVIDIVMSDDINGAVMTTAIGTNGDAKIVSIKPVQLKNGNSPLYVVDGKEVENLDEIYPHNIESITVLKEQSAIAVYGEKAKNGVVLITLKK